MGIVVTGLCVVPLLAAVASGLLRPRVAAAVSVGAAGLSLGLAVALIVPTRTGAVRVGFLRADALSEVFVLATAFLYLMTMIYCIGYLHDELRLPGLRRYARRFFVGINLFAWSMLAAPLMNGLALLWVAIEVTTVVSALLVAIEDTEGATEAAWKYVLLASTGLGVALLATVFMYYAGSTRLGAGYDLAFAPLLEHASELPADPVRLAFVLAVVGFGTKVGLVPMHTWLPDAHAEAPTPVSVLLSGALLATSMYAVIRYYQVAVGSLGPRFPQTVLLVFGIASLLLAALYLLGQHDVKRLLAYSSIEHMGILAIGLSFGGSVAAAGVLLHVLAHAAGKGGAFMGAGVLVRSYRTKELSRIRDAITVLPWSGPMFLLLIFGLSAFPPSGIFRSEFQIVHGGLSEGHHVGAVVAVLLSTLAFGALALATTRIVCSPGDHLPRPGEPSRWMTVPMALCLLALAVLGLHPPGALSDLLSAAATQLAAGTS